MSLLLELCQARLQRLAVEQSGERVEDGVVAVLQLRLGEGRRDDGDNREERERGDHQPGVVREALGINGHGGRQDDDGRQPGEGHDDRAPETGGGHGTRDDQPGCGRAVGPTGPGDAERQHQENQEQGLGGHALRVCRALQPALEGRQRDRGDHEERQRPPRRPGHADDDRDADHRKGDRTCRPHPSVRVDDAGMIELGGHQPGTGLHAYVVGSGPPYMRNASHPQARAPHLRYPNTPTGGPVSRRPAIRRLTGPTAAGTCSARRWSRCPSGPGAPRAYPGRRSRPGRSHRLPPPGRCSRR